MKKTRPLTLYILIAMVLGAAVGYGCHETVADKQISADIAAHISIVTDVFLRLIKMIISLLVFSTLTVGIAHMGDGRAAGRIGMKAMGWFVIASLISLSLGILMAAHGAGTLMGMALSPLALRLR